MPSTIEYPENPSAQLYVLEDDDSWSLLEETNKLASNTASSSLVVNILGIIPLTDTDNLQTTLALFSMGKENAGDAILHLEDEILQGTLARTIRSRPGDTGAGKCRMSGVPATRVGGVRRNSGRAKAKSRARKEVAHLELRQYRQQFMEAKQKTNRSLG